MPKADATADSAGSPPEAGPFRYWAFISYNHRDLAWARRIHAGLEHYRVPRSLVGKASVVGAIPRRLMPVFRDQDELPGASNLRAVVRDALDVSRALVVICSPNAAQSRWVNEEIAYFRRLGRGDRILSVIVAGEPTAVGEESCFPPELRTAAGAGLDADRESGGVEPLAVDLRPGHGTPRDVRLRLVAGILGLGYDDLRQRDARRRRKLRRVWGSLAGAGAALAAVGYTLAADAGLRLPLAGEIRRQMDRFELKVFRPWLDREAVAARARPLREALQGRLTSELKSGKWKRKYVEHPHGATEGIDVWTTSQAATALLSCESLSPDDARTAADGVGRAFVPNFPIEIDGVKYGWLPGPASYTQAEPALWTAAATASALRRLKESNDARIPALTAQLEFAQEAANHYAMPDGSWHTVGGTQFPERANVYTATLALLALLESQRADLPWCGSRAQRDALLAKTAEWLVDHYDPLGSPPGWHGRADQQGGATLDGMNLQLFAELLWAESQAGLAIPDRVRDAIPVYLAQLDGRPLDFPSDSYRPEYVFRDHFDKPRQQQINVKCLWHPWGVAAAALWLDSPHASAAPIESRVAVQRSLTWLVVGLEVDLDRSVAKSTRASYIASETLYAFSILERRR